MAQNTLFVRLDANDATAAIGDPTRPFTLRGAIDRINASSKVAWFLDVGRGTFNLPCPGVVPIRSSVTLTGTGPKSTIINAYELSIEGGVSVTFQGMGLRTCSSRQLFHVRSGTLTINNTEITVLAGTLFRFTDGMAVINGSIVYINAVASNPVINATGGALIVNNTTFFFKMTSPANVSMSLIGTTAKTQSIVLNNVGVSVEMAGGSQPVIAFYNIPIVNNAIVQVQGSGRDTFILFGLDIAATGTNDPPYYGTNVTASIRGVTSVYTSYNMSEYPLILRNVTWSGVATQPGVYMRGPNASVQSPVRNLNSIPTGPPPQGQFNGIPVGALPQGQMNQMRQTNDIPAGALPQGQINQMRQTNGIPAGALPQGQFNQIPNGGRFPQEFNPASNNVPNQGNGQQRDLDIETDYGPLNQRGYGDNLDDWTRNELSTDNDMDILGGY